MEYLGQGPDGSQSPKYSLYGPWQKKLADSDIDERVESPFGVFLIHGSYKRRASQARLYFILSSDRMEIQNDKCGYEVKPASVTKRQPVASAQTGATGSLRLWDAAEVFLCDHARTWVRLLLHDWYPNTRSVSVPFFKKCLLVQGRHLSGTVRALSEHRVPGLCLFHRVTIPRSISPVPTSLGL